MIQLECSRPVTHGIANAIHAQKRHLAWGAMGMLMFALLALGNAEASAWVTPKGTPFPRGCRPGVDESGSDGSEGTEAQMSTRNGNAKGAQPYSGSVQRPARKSEPSDVPVHVVDPKSNPGPVAAKKPKRPGGGTDPAAASIKDPKKNGEGLPTGDGRSNPNEKTPKRNENGKRKGEGSSNDRGSGKGRAAFGVTGSRKVFIFNDPWELFLRVKPYLGIGKTHSVAPPPLPDMRELMKRVDALNAMYRSSKNAKKKRSLQSEIRGAALDVLFRKFQVSIKDFAQRRKIFVGDLLNTLFAVSQSNNWDSIFRVPVSQLRPHLIRVLRVWPPEEVTAALWGMLQCQERQAGKLGLAREKEFNRQIRVIMKQSLRSTQVLARDAGASGKASKVVDLNERAWHLWKLAVDRDIARAAGKGQDKRFKKEVAEFLVEIGAHSAKPVSKGLLDKHPQVLLQAGLILRRLGTKAVPDLIAILEEHPSREAALLLSGVTRQAFGMDGAAWNTWWKENGSILKKNNNGHRHID